MSKLAVTVDGQRFEIEMVLTPDCDQGCAVKVNGEEVHVTVPESDPPSPNIEWMIINGRPRGVIFTVTVRFQLK